MNKTLPLAGLLSVLATPAAAILNGTPAPELGNLVGQINGSSGVVVADDFVLSARHVAGAGGTFTLGGTSYTPIETISFNGTGGRPNTDLVLLRFAPNTFTSFAAISYDDPTGKTLTLAGYGPGGTLRASGAGYTSDGPENVAGVLRRGVNFASGIANVDLSNISPGATSVPSILFDLDGNGKDSFNDGGPIMSGGTNLDASFVPGDSGGGTFVTQGGFLHLVGINSFALSEENIKGTGSTSIRDFGGGGGAVYLGTYRSFIESTIHPVPEPASMLALAGAVGALALRRRRR